jgi:hypothetical protein
LLCPWCEATGLVILYDEQLDRLEQVRAHARTLGLSDQLERKLDYLAGYDGSQCVLGYDFAPHSFSFCLYRPGPKEERKFRFNGGLIFQGPSTTAQRILTFYAKAPSGTRSIIRFLPNPSRGDCSWMSSNFWR